MYFNRIKIAVLHILVIVMVLSVFEITPFTLNTYAAETEEAESNYDKWMDTCDTMLKNLKKKGFRYSNSGTKSTYRRAKSSGKKCNCALYVSWCLQEYGATDSGDTFYIRGGRIRKRFGWNSKKVKVMRVYRRPSSAKLQPGDVCCWAGVPHVNIYAGKSSSGKKLWYDGGKISTRGNSNGSRYTKTGKKALGYLNHRRISYIIRIKDLDD